MNLVGKIFTLLIFVLSMMCLAFSLMVVGTHKNWRKIAVDELKPQINDVNDRITKLQNEKEDVTKRLERERAARRAALGGLRTRLDNLKTQLADREKELSNLTGKLGQDLVALADKQRELTEKTQNVVRTRNEIQIAAQKRDNQYDRVVAMTDSLNQAEGVKVRLQERRNQLQDQVTLQRKVLGRLGVKFDPKRAEVIAVKNVHGEEEHILVASIAHQVEGRVSKVSAKAKGAMQISLGAHDGLKVGHTLEVYRDKLYLGRVIVERLRSDSAVVKIIPATRKGEIKAGDKVVTRFSPEYLRFLRKRGSAANGGSTIGDSSPTS